jgi:hypothetical protein
MGDLPLEFFLAIVILAAFILPISVSLYLIRKRKMNFLPWSFVAILTGYIFWWILYLMSKEKKQS